MRFRTLPALITLLAVVLAVPAQAQTTHVVPGPGTPTIQSAIDAAQSGDTILIAAGTFTESLSINGKDLTFQGAGIDMTQLDAGNSVGIALLSGSGGKTIIRDLEIQGGSRPPSDPRADWISISSGSAYAMPSAWPSK